MAVNTLPLEYVDIKYLKSSPSRLLLFALLSIVTFPFLLLWVLWFPVVFSRIARCPVDDPRKAQYVLVQKPAVDDSSPATPSTPANSNQKKNLKKGEWVEAQVHRIHDQAGDHIYFDFKKQRYVLVDEGVRARFVRIDPRLVGQPFSVPHSYARGVTSKQAERFIAQYGLNSIDLDPKPVWRMLIDKVFHPFYLFQAASVVIWFNNSYESYATVILLLAIISIISEIYTEKRNERNLRNLVKLSHTCRVIRDNIIHTIPSQQVIVGDAVLLEHDSPVVCDMVLVQGEVVADESALTGETVPVVK
ncbi:hypothetical protein HK102_008252, partial [Quaeritorhiza haematococci]